MNLTAHTYQNEDTYWRIRQFLRETFLLNDRLERSWHVSRFEYFRWHFIVNCQFSESLEKAVVYWENKQGKIIGVLTPITGGEVRLHVHPQDQTKELLDAMITYAEQHLSDEQEGKCQVYFPADQDDAFLQEALSRKHFEKRDFISHKWHRDLIGPIPEYDVSEGYTVRSMGPIEEHPARSLASWRAFHADEPEDNYDHDWSWYQNIQNCPLYRRDLDIVAVATDTSIASFCTALYDDATRSAVCVLVGTAQQHQRRGLGKAVIFEAMRRMKRLGCTRVFATAYDPPANALYRSVMQTNTIAETWSKHWTVQKLDC